jgi:hypothetical protein
MVDLDSPDLSMGSFPLLAGFHGGYHTLLREGEMLYIPPLFWYYVRSLESEIFSQFFGGKTFVFHISDRIYSVW